MQTQKRANHCLQGTSTQRVAASKQRKMRLADEIAQYRRTYLQMRDLPISKNCPLFHLKMQAAISDARKSHGSTVNLLIWAIDSATTDIRRIEANLIKEDPAVTAEATQEIVSDLNRMVAGLQRLVNNARPGTYILPPQLDN
ncbi:hypothetical protein Fcan01_12535 [Folsomia candida]|uniref:Uncharacterized protein n=1 Tax=Folsomia candida TaxID=158441 RepID=A0A226E7D1_FOLCA|nr:hypothetical protein Fcan01_12535 [Folsomia candida]